MEAITTAIATIFDGIVDGIRALYRRKTSAANAATTWSPVAEHLIKQFEGLRLESYNDGGGTWTIGWGHTKGIHPGMTCTREQAQQWLEDDMTNASQAVIALTTRPLAQYELDALTSFVLNVGSHAFAASHLRSCVNRNRTKAAEREFMRWDHMGARVLRGLQRRRLAESKLYAHA